MIKKFTFFLFVLIIFFVPFVRSQPTVNLIVDESRISSEIGSILIVNGISGAPSLFCVDITPTVPGDNVTLECTLEWQPPENGGFQLLGSFTTDPFPAQRVCNEQLGSSQIRISKWNTNQQLIDETRQRGKLTGRYRLSIRATEKGVSSPWAVKVFDFPNPTQTLSIIQPNAGREYDAGNVLAEWNIVPGATYEIKANVRKSSNQSLEDALNTGTPLINNKNVGSVTSINLHSILEREWQPGDEIVFQVAAVTGSGTKLYSNIVNFVIRNNNPTVNNTLTSQLSQLAQLLGVAGLANDFRSGKIKILESMYDDGSLINLNDLSNIINSLLANPKSIIKIEFNNH